jgi:hypothetical protein
MKFNNLISLIEENYTSDYIIGFHGSESTDNLQLDNDKLFWCALNRDSHLLDFYAKRGALYEVKFQLGNSLDLRMYDTDEYLDYDSAKQFLIDCDLSDTAVKTWQFTFFDDVDEVMLTQVLNAIIKEELIPSKKFDSVLIKEDEDDTVCILNTRLIQQIYKAT